MAGDFGYGLVAEPVVALGGAVGLVDAAAAAEAVARVLEPVFVLVTGLAVALAAVELEAGAWELEPVVAVAVAVAVAAAVSVAVAAVLVPVSAAGAAVLLAVVAAPFADTDAAFVTKKLACQLVPEPPPLEPGLEPEPGPVVPELRGTAVAESALAAPVVPVASAPVEYLHGPSFP